MIVWVDLDTFGYRLASFIATFGYASYHCYFAGKDIVIKTLDLYTETFKVLDKGFSYWEVLMFNFAWTQPTMVENFRQLKHNWIKGINVKNFTATGNM